MSRTGRPDSPTVPPRRRSTAPGSIPPTIGPGTVLEGKYELVEELGEGAMGVVYLGKDVQLQRSVAIKFIQPDMVRSDEAHERFLHEARAMARVKHVNVVDIYAYGELARTPYFVMEYVRGPTVYDWLEQHGRPHLSIDEAIGILDQTCRGIAAIHAAGAVHRDLKPTNVLIGPAFRVCVMDLGLSKVLDRPASAPKDTVSGTPAYMAPEVVMGTPLSGALEQQADVYALGVMAFEMVTGRLPFIGKHAAHMILRHIEDDPVPPSDVADVPKPFSELILRLMSKNPGDRYTDGRDLIQALTRVRESIRGVKTP